MVVVSAVFKYDGFQMGRAGMDIFTIFHLLRGGVAENTEILNVRFSEDSQDF